MEDNSRPNAGLNHEPSSLASRLSLGATKGSDKTKRIRKGLQAVSLMSIPKKRSTPYLSVISSRALPTIFSIRG